MKYIFKGDDDILLVPENFYAHIQQLASSNDPLASIGCLKSSGEKVVRQLTSKYFMPESLVPYETYQPYYSGAGYIVTQEVAQKMYQHYNRVPLVPLDDTYIGMLLHFANLSRIFRNTYCRKRSSHHSCHALSFFKLRLALL